MQITKASAVELGLLIKGLRAVWYMDASLQRANDRLLRDLENQLSTRHGARVPPDNATKGVERDKIA